MMSDDNLAVIPADPNLGPVPELAIPRCEKGIGEVILQTGSTGFW
jgi:hypothetical protein